MRATVIGMLCVAVLVCGVTAEAASKKQARRISEYCHICEAASRISERLVRMLAKHPYESGLAAYAGKIADVNADIFRKLGAPAGAEKVKEHFGKAAAAFKRAVVLHKKAEYKASDEAGRECLREFLLAVAEVRRLRKEGVIP